MYHSGASRYVKLLGAGFLGFAVVGYGILWALIAGAIFALVTWLVIRRTAIEDYSINTKPTFVMLAVIGLFGCIVNYSALRATDVAPVDAALDSLATLAGVLLIVSVIGIKVAPRISYVSEVDENYAQD